jgi:spore coat polysaccharide biosynthesis predicted glycosyltransferase SpsG
MNRDPILFRVEGTLRTGWERLYRCLTFAAALQRRRRPTYFLSQLDPPTLAFAIKRTGTDWLPANHPVGSVEDLEELQYQIQRLHPAAVVVDSPDTLEPYLQHIRSSGTVVVSLDHLATVRFPSRLVINPLLAPGKESFEFHRGTQLLVGARYALVRPEVRRARPLRAQEPPQPFRVMVALGDEDPHGQTMELTKLLMNCPRVGRVDAVVRPHHQALAEFQKMAESHPGRFEVATEPGEVTSRLARCHLGVTAGNSWSLELACVGVPQLIIVQNEAHWPTAQRLEEEGAALCLGWYATLSAQTIRQGVQNLLTDAEERQAMSRCGRRLIDGRGPDRLVTGLEVLLHSREGKALEKAA